MIRSQDHLNESLCHFLQHAVTPFHAVQALKSQLMNNGYQALQENENWSLCSGKYFVTRNDSSIIAFQLNFESLDSGIRMIGTHTDSPCLKPKPNADLYAEGYHQLGVEVYGGALLNPWFDRDLGLAGRLTFTEDNEAKQRLIKFPKPLGVIPSLAIHLDREANNQRKINPQTYLPVILSQQKDTLFEIVKKQLMRQYPELVDPEILAHNLCFYDFQPPQQIGYHQEFIASARLDNLLSCYIGLQSLLNAKNKQNCLLVCNDHEEIGSTSAIGAQGPFLKTILERIISAHNTSQYPIFAHSKLLSVDNAHGIHPNFADKHDKSHGPLINQGPVIKLNANQRYATNDMGNGLIKTLCKKENIPVQEFVVRSDMGCGSTIGPLTAANIGVDTIDIGVATFAMHSIRELAGVKDTYYLFRLLKCFYND